MPKVWARAIMYSVLLLSLYVTYLSISYLFKVLRQPLVVLEPVHGSAVLDGKMFQGLVELPPGRHVVVGECKIRLFGGRLKVVRFPYFEVDVQWGK